MNLFVLVACVSAVELGSQYFAIQSLAARANCASVIGIRCRTFTPLRNDEQGSVDVSERVQTMATVAQVTKRSPPFFRKAACRINPYRITAFHKLVKHLADSSE